MTKQKSKLIQLRARPTLSVCIPAYNEEGNIGRTIDIVSETLARVDIPFEFVIANDNSKDRPEEAIAARVINYIDPDKGASTSVLANRMKIKQPALEAILAKMEAAGMIRKERGKKAWKGKVADIWVIV